jgi:hypothetical protein
LSSFRMLSTSPSKQPSFRVGYGFGCDADRGGEAALDED